MNINGYELVNTCRACPEQYNVYLDGKMVAYLRLRHGHFRCDIPVAGGRTIYEAYPQGDGIFEEHERLGYLTEAIQAVMEATR